MHEHKNTCPTRLTSYPVRLPKLWKVYQPAYLPARHSRLLLFSHDACEETSRLFKEPALGDKSSSRMTVGKESSGENTIMGMQYFYRLRYVYMVVISHVTLKRPIAWSFVRMYDLVSGAVAIDYCCRCYSWTSRIITTRIFARGGWRALEVSRFFVLLYSYPCPHSRKARSRFFATGYHPTQTIPKFFLALSHKHVRCWSVRYNRMCIAWLRLHVRSLKNKSR